MPLERHFEKFTGGPTRPTADRLNVTISKTGRFYLNRNAYNALGRPQAVILHFSRETDVIAIEPSNARLAVSFPLYEAQLGWIVNAAPFCNHFNIKPSATERFTEPVVSNDGFMKLDLKNTVTVRVRRRKTGKSK